eukprot:2602957-Alexandrium_andersonii.AAC.1
MAGFLACVPVCSGGDQTVPLRLADGDEWDRFPVGSGRIGKSVLDNRMAELSTFDDLPQKPR